MINITFIRADGTERTVVTSSGMSLMQVAKDNGFEEILAECGGAGACATCHCYISNEWLAQIPHPDETEAEMLTIVPEPLPISRLSCQINLTDSMDGLIVKLPESQY